MVIAMTITITAVVIGMAEIAVDTMANRTSANTVNYASVRIRATWIMAAEDIAVYLNTRATVTAMTVIITARARMMVEIAVVRVAKKPNTSFVRIVCADSQERPASLSETLAQEGVVMEVYSKAMVTVMMAITTVAVNMMEETAAENQAKKLSSNTARLAPAKTQPLSARDVKDHVVLMLRSRVMVTVTMATTIAVASMMAVIAVVLPEKMAILKINLSTVLLALARTQKSTVVAFAQDIVQQVEFSRGMAIVTMLITTVVANTMAAIAVENLDRPTKKCTAQTALARTLTTKHNQLLEDRFPKEMLMKWDTDNSLYSSH